MDENEKNVLTRQLLELGKKTFKVPELTEREKVKLEIITELYKSSPKTRTYIDRSIDLYSLAFVAKRTEILMDGLEKLGKIIFGAEEDESA